MSGHDRSWSRTPAELRGDLRVDAEAGLEVPNSIGEVDRRCARLLGTRHELAAREHIGAKARERHDEAATPLE